MPVDQDLEILKQAGIASLAALASSAAAFVREHPIYRTQAMPNALSEDEEAFLRRTGAISGGVHAQAAADANVTVIAAEYAQMVASAYSQKEVAGRLGVSTSRVRQRLDSRSLFWINGAAGRVCPRFQFVDDATLPGFEQVLKAISPEAHPIAVQRFFLKVSPDLLSHTFGQALSPRDWLATGHPVDPVVVLAREL